MHLVDLSPSRSAKTNIEMETSCPLGFRNIMVNSILYIHIEKRKSIFLEELITDYLVATIKY